MFQILSCRVFCIGLILMVIADGIRILEPNLINRISFTIGVDALFCWAKKDLLNILLNLETYHILAFIMVYILWFPTFLKEEPTSVIYSIFPLKGLGQILC